MCLRVGGSLSKWVSGGMYGTAPTWAKPTLKHSAAQLLSQTEISPDSQLLHVADG